MMKRILQYTLKAVQWQLCNSSIHTCHCNVIFHPLVNELLTTEHVYANCCQFAGKMRNFTDCLGAGESLMYLCKLDIPSSCWCVLRTTDMYMEIWSLLFSQRCWKEVDMWPAEMWVYIRTHLRNIPATQHWSNIGSPHCPHFPTH